jgi:hypothetical protein
MSGWVEFYGITWLKQQTPNSVQAVKLTVSDFILKRFVNCGLA